ncbi:hypothetical protein [Tahibacter amnicola]|uniref:Uncharacterized protein n=1 Tax=Tahibacter amnicola TaxID=2976241 RepID=A0ABY6B887_9GAMM|nr:hypothetical protein [Tahibacter amnicola]UXI65889.1 hypothetical protein N4264_14095 [Tahibacter amnicola]
MAVTACSGGWASVIHGTLCVALSLQSATASSLAQPAAADRQRPDAVGITI